MKRLLKKLPLIVSTVMLVLMLFSLNVSADFGPKPSVNVTFENMGDELCYGTLLSSVKSTGPYSVWSGDEDEMYYYEQDGRYAETAEDIGIGRAFTEYEDPDGYYFLQISWKVSEKKELVWSYYPPQSFKILLYYPETGRFTVSDVCERYAFDTYYTVDMSGTDIGSAEYNEELSGNERLDAHRSYRFKDEIVSLVLRIVITIIIETWVALAFGFSGKTALLYLTVINAITQIILNVLLNVINFNSGQMAFVFGYVMLEIVVFAIEAVAYVALRSRLTKKLKPKWFYVLYSFVANAVSFAAGLLTANIFPGIF